MTERIRKATAAAVTSIVTASLLVAGSVPAQAAKPSHLTARPEVRVPGGAGNPVQGKAWPVRRTPDKPAPAPVWPAAGTTRVDLGVARGVRAVGTPVTMERKAPDGPASATVSVLDRAKVPPGWRNGIVVRLTRSDGKATAAPARVAIDYSGFASAFGANWADRLKLWQLPECALTTPGATGCSAKVLPSRHDGAGVVSADLAVAAGSGSLVALAADAGGDAGSSGDFGATSMEASSSWSAGGSSGDFSWNYEMRVPPSNGGPAPPLALSYSSATVDGRSDATNNQPSWIGEGFDYWPGYIERRYIPCSEDMSGTHNNPDKTGDQCWKSDNATLNLPGHGGELIYEAGKGWHSRTEDGSKVEKLTGATNGDDNGEYWKVTITDGTQFFFGLNNLPGQSSATQSAWTLPVYGNNPTEPGYTAGDFAASAKTQAWRWNLDYMVDVHGNTMSLWYTPETNKYAARVTDSAVSSYIRGGTLSRIDYGTYWRPMAEFGLTQDEKSITPTGQVLFETSDRCLSSCSDHANWHDTPWDQDCSSSSSCPGQYSPTFWSKKRLTKVTTQVWDTTVTPAKWQPVDSWTFTHRFPPSGDDTIHGGLWLDSIVHAGLIGTTPITMPPVTLTEISMANRVVTRAQSDSNWFRLAEIISETGARTQVSYSLPECTSSNLPTADSNTKRCYPMIVDDPDNPDAKLTEWWHKYVVTRVSESDLNILGAPTKETNYEYVGSPAWHYTDDDGFTKPERKTWSQWRGYATVKSRAGANGGQQTLTVTNFMRGMHGDRLSDSGGTRTVTVPASIGSETVYDEDSFADMIREQTTYNGVETKPVNRTVNVPWQSPATASRTISGDTVSARFTNTQTTYTSTALGVDGAGGWRTQRTATTFDNTYGMPTSVEDDGAWTADANDHSLDGDEKCATTTYNRNTAKNLVQLVKQVTKTALKCGVAPASTADVVSDLRNYYDGTTSIDTVPTLGNATKVEQLKDWTTGSGTVWQTLKQMTYDSTGRSITDKDVRGNTLTTAYVPAVGGPLTAVKTLTQQGWLTIVTQNPYWGSMTVKTDPNLHKNEAEYDALGRVVRVWNVGWDKAGHETRPSTEYFYFTAPNRNAYPYLRTKTLNAAGNYTIDYKIMDALARPRQTQAQAIGSGWIISSTFYDSLGQVTTTHGAYWADESQQSVIPGQVWNQSEGTLPRVNRTEYDAASRPTAQIFLAREQVGTQFELHEKWRTTTRYQGDRTLVTPPSGGVPTTTITDITGRTVELREHNTSSGMDGGYLASKYTYNRKDQLQSITDSAGDVWSNTYDARGNQLTAKDPDTGTTLNEYNDINDLIKTTDSRGEVLAYKYDAIGRRTAVYDDSTTTGTLRAEWKYDTLYTGIAAKGLLTQTIRYDGGVAYKWQVTDFSTRDQPAGINIVIPNVAATTGVSGMWTYGYKYNDYTGTPYETTYPQVPGDLTAEVVTTTFNAQGLPSALKTNYNLNGVVTYVNVQSYSPYGEPTVTQRKTLNGSYVDTVQSYDDATRRLEEATVKPEILNQTVSDRKYFRDDVGNIISVSDTPQSGSSEKQCFSYDTLARLVEAWTPALATDCKTTAPSLAGLSGPAPYWQSWTINNLGDRTKQVTHASGGDITQTLSYPTPGATTVRPHAHTSVTTNGVVKNYTYDNAGNTLTRPGVAGGTQTFAWDAESKLTSVTEGTASTTNLYDANGTRLIRRDVSGITLYLPGMEVRRNTGASTSVGTRYYSFAGMTIASRTMAGGLTWLIDDHQGTQQIAINAASQAVSIRRQLPYGAPRGTQPTWPNQKGFVSGDIDATGLTHLGAREYDPTTGRFISVDPIFDATNPQSWNGYAYSGNSPISMSDPAGTKACDDGTDCRTGKDLKPLPACEGAKGSTRNCREQVNERDYRERERRLLQEMIDQREITTEDVVKAAICGSVDACKRRMGPLQMEWCKTHSGCIMAMSQALYAYDKAEKLLKSGVLSEGEANAFRHSFWMAQMVFHGISEKDALLLGAAHEADVSVDNHEWGTNNSVIDMHNNLGGTRLAADLKWSPKVWTKNGRDEDDVLADVIVSYVVSHVMSEDVQYGSANPAVSAGRLNLLGQ